jgi:hypothetical protein
LRQFDLLLFIGTVVAQRDESHAWSLELSLVENNGSSILTIALASGDDAVRAGIRMLSTATLNPRISRILASFSGVVPGSIPVMQATEKSVGRETLTTCPKSLKQTDAPAKSRIRSSSGS